MVDFREIAKIVISYYQYPEETAKKIRDKMGWVRETSKPAEAAGGEAIG